MFSKIKMRKSLLPCSSVNRSKVVIDIGKFGLLFLNFQKEWKSLSKLPLFLVRPSEIIESHQINRPTFSGGGPYGFEALNGPVHLPQEKICYAEFSGYVKIF